MAHPKEEVTGVQAEQKITVLKIIGDVVFEAFVEKDSPEGYWRLKIEYLGFKKISVKPQSAEILVKEVFPALIKPGRYKIVSREQKNGLPLFEAVA